MTLPDSVIHPLGLAGFALALVFGAIAAVSTASRRWLVPTAACLAAVSIAGGIALEWRRSEPLATQEDVKRVPSPDPGASSLVPGPVTAGGDCSFAAGGVTIGGSVDIACNKSEGATAVPPQRP